MSNAQEDRVRVRHRLEAKGISCADLYDLRKSPEDLKKAAPVLLDMLREIRSPAVKIDMIRVASTARIPPGRLMEELNRLKVEFERDPTAAENLLNLAWTIADGLAGLADASVYDDLVEALHANALGEARQMLPYAMARVKARRQDTIRTLLPLVNDEDVAAQVVDVLGRLKATEAVPAIRVLLHSPQRLVRTEATKALRRLERQTGAGTRSRARRTAPDATLAETAANFDVVTFPDFLRTISQDVDRFGPDKIAEIEARLGEMECDDEEVLEFEIVHNGEQVPLVIEIYMNDESAADVRFRSRPGVIAAVEEKLNTWECALNDE